MANHTIKIDLGGFEDRQPWLKISVDGGEWTTSRQEDEDLVTIVTAGQTVQFVINAGSPISSIDGIINYPSNNFNIFKIDPSAENDWMGTIGDEKGEESYAIKYTLDGQEFLEDPKMKMI